MPSPIAHCSMVALLKPLDKRGLIPDALKQHRLALLGLALFACVVPDIDFAIGMVAPGTALGTHGYGMHSLAMTALASLVLAGLWRAVFRSGFVTVFVLALMCSWSHLLFDAMTYKSRGIGVFWPFIDERYRLPISAFFGVRHDQPGAWPMHLITVTTEAVFAGVVWYGSRLLSRRKQDAKQATPTHTEVEHA